MEQDQVSVFLSFFKLASYLFTAASWVFANGVTTAAVATRGGGVTIKSSAYPPNKGQKVTGLGRTSQRTVFHITEFECNFWAIYTVQHHVTQCLPPRSFHVHLPNCFRWIIGIFLWFLAEYGRRWTLDSWRKYWQSADENVDLSNRKHISWGKSLDIYRPIGMLHWCLCRVNVRRLKPLRYWKPHPPNGPPNNQVAMSASSRLP